MARSSIDLITAGRELARRSCEQQGVALKISDPVVLRNVAALILATEADAQRGSQVA